MTGIQFAQLAALIIVVVNGVLVVGLVTLKTVHRRRVVDHDRRRSGYVTLLSRHLAFENCTDPIGERTAADPAFLDALIDVRGALAGPEVETLRGIVDRYGVVRRLAGRLETRWRLGRKLRAAVALAELGDETSARLLMDHLDDSDDEVRLQAARGLARMQWTPAIDVIVGRFNIETPWVRTRFADNLVGFGRQATWPLCAYVTVNHPYETAGPAAAIRALAVIGDEQAVHPLLGVLEESSNPEIQIATIDALGMLGGPLVVAPLHQATESEDWRIRAKAATALGDVGDPRSAELLAGCLLDLNWWVRRNSAAALAVIPGGVDHLYEALDGPDPFAGDAAAEALLDRGDLVAARKRSDRGLATSRDMRLIDYMVDSSGVLA